MRELAQNTQTETAKINRVRVFLCIKILLSFFHRTSVPLWQRAFRGGVSLTIATSSEPQHKRYTVRHLVKTRSRFDMKEALEACIHATSHE